MDLDTLFKLSYSMCIVSSKKNGNLNGCIVNTVAQITPEPPIIIASVNRCGLTCEYIESSKVFTVSILAEETPMSFIGHFGFCCGRDKRKFENVRYKIGQTGAPIVLDHTVAYIEAEVIQSIIIETHTLFIAKVIGCEILDNSRMPMTYSYYRDVKRGRTPKSAATYHEEKKKQEKQKTVKERDLKMKRYRCLLCSYIYDPQEGDPENGVEPGTPFEDLPDGWVCPDCGAEKTEFEAIEED